MLRKLWGWLRSDPNFRTYLVDNQTREVTGPTGLNFFNYDSLVLTPFERVEFIPGRIHLQSRFTGTIGAPDLSDSTTRSSLELDRGCS